MDHGPIPDHDVTGPETWTAAELATDDRWVYALSDAERRELAAAVDDVKGRGLEAFRFGRDDFPLPTLAARIAAVVD